MNCFRVGCPEMPDLDIKVIPTYGTNQYSYTLLQDFLSAKVRAELKVSNFVFYWNNICLFIL